MSREKEERLSRMNFTQSYLAYFVGQEYILYDFTASRVSLPNSCTCASYPYQQSRMPVTCQLLSYDFNAEILLCLQAGLRDHTAAENIVIGCLVCVAADKKLIEI